MVTTIKINNINDLHAKRGRYINRNDVIIDLNLQNKNLSFFPDLENLNIYKLYLYNNKIPSVPDYICNFIKLEFLNLSNNQIIVLPESIHILTSLISINLDNNSIITIPETLTRLGKLKSLSFINNNIENIPETIGNLISLIELKMNRNSISYIPESIGDLSNLIHFTAGFNKISTLPNSINNLLKLSFLELNDNNLLYFPKIDGLDSLQKLLLDNNRELKNKIVISSTLLNINSINISIHNTLITEISRPTNITLSSQTMKDLEDNLIIINTPVDTKPKKLFLFVNMTLDIINISRIIDEKRKNRLI